MKALYGAVRPTARYPRFVWNGITVDLMDALQMAVPDSTPIGARNVTESGKPETVLTRLDRQWTILTSHLDAVGCEEMRRFLEDWAELGEPFEFHLDRFLRAFWGFEGHGGDNNTANPFGNTYQDAPSNNPNGVALTFAAMADGGQGVQVPSAVRQALRAQLVSRLDGGSANAFMVVGTEGGIMALVIKPDWAFADGLEHVLVDAVVPNALGANRLQLVKRAGNKLYLVYFGGNGGETMIDATPASWSANTEHTILCQWGALADLKVKVDGTLFTTKKYVQRYGSTIKYSATHKYGELAGGASGNEQVWSAAPTRMTLGVDDQVLGGRATGLVGMIALYRGLYDGLLNDRLGTFQHPWKSYFPKGEVIGGPYRPQRVSVARELYTYQLAIRDGS